MKVSEIVSENVRSAITNFNTWGGLIVNVKTYGAEGNGTTVDTAAIQDAINYAISVGKSEVYFPAGTYLYTTLTNTSGMTFVGDGVTLNGTTPLTLISFAVLSAEIGVIGNLNTTATNLVSAINEVKSTVGTTKTSPNLLINSSAQFNLDAWTMAGVFSTEEGNNLFGTTGKYFINSQVTAGSPEYLLSEKIYVSAATNLNLSSEVYLEGVSGSVTVYVIAYDISGGFLGYVVFNNFDNVYTSWRALSATGATPALTNHVRVRIQKDNSTSGYAAWRRIKLEVGTSKTPYSTEADLMFAAGLEKHNIRYMPLIYADGVRDDAPGIQNAINLYDVLYFPVGTYKIATAITLPQNRNIRIYGDGLKNTVFALAPGINAFSYQRDSTSFASSLIVEGIYFIENTYAKTTTAFVWKGYSTAKHDNWMRIENCIFEGLKWAVNSGFAGMCHFVGLHIQTCLIAFKLDRDASFFFFERCVALACGSFVYADDTLADGISNGVTINNCHSVASTNIDVRILGWQAVFINGCGFDLGTIGQCAAYFNKCSDVRITNCWIATDSATTPGRNGAEFVNCNIAGVVNTSFSNNHIGINVFNNVAWSDKVIIESCSFVANSVNDIYLDGAKVCKIVNNTITSTPSRTGTNFEIYGNTTNSNYHIIQYNSFAGSSYTITAGAQSVIGNSLFGAPA